MKTPSVADFITYARLMNGVCEKCGKVKTHDKKLRCKCEEPCDA